MSRVWHDGAELVEAWSSGPGAVSERVATDLLVQRCRTSAGA